MSYVGISFKDQKVNTYFLSGSASEFDEFFFGAVGCGSPKQRVLNYIVVREEKTNHHYIH